MTRDKWLTRFAGVLGCVVLTAQLLGPLALVRTQTTGRM